MSRLFNFKTVTISMVASIVVLGIISAAAQARPRSFNSGEIDGQGSSFADLLLTGGTTPGTTKRNAWFNVFGEDSAPDNQAAPTPPAFGLGPVLPGQNIGYGSVGSGGGRTAFLICGKSLVENVSSTTVDFSVTATPAAPPFPFNPPVSLPTNVPCRGNAQPLQVPLALGAVAIAYTPGAVFPPNTNATIAQICGIFNGATTTVGSVTINKVYVRAGNSGTTGILTKFLNANCSNVPGGLTGIPPVGESYPLPGPPNTVVNTLPPFITNSQLMAQAIKTCAPNQVCVGYLDAATAVKEGLDFYLINGRSPISTAQIAAAATGVTDIDPNPRRIQINIPAVAPATAYPIVGTTYAWFYGEPTASNVATANPTANIYSAAQRKQIADFVSWYTFKKTTCPVTSTSADCLINNFIGGYAPLPGQRATVGAEVAPFAAAACPANNATSTNIRLLVNNLIKGCI